MKRTLVVLPLMLFSTVAAAATELSASAGIDWMLGVRGGFEYLFLPPVGVQVHAGVTVAGTATGDLLLAIRVARPTERLELRLLAGVPNAVLPFGTSEYMLSLGGAVEGRWWFARRFALALRLGEGYPLFFSGGRHVAKTIGFPLGLWPDLYLSLWFRP